MPRYKVIHNSASGACIEVLALWGVSDQQGGYNYSSLVFCKMPRYGDCQVTR